MTLMYITAWKTHDLALGLLIDGIRYLKFIIKKNKTLALPVLAYTRQGLKRCIFISCYRLL